MAMVGTQVIQPLHRWWIVAYACTSKERVFGIRHPVQDAMITVLCLTICCCVQVARGVIGVVVIGHFPLNHNPARQGLESLENYLLGWKHISFGLSCLQAVVFVSVSLSIALAVSL